MASLVVAGVAAGGGFGAAGAASTIALTVVATAAAAYIDSEFIMPALMGSDAPEDDYEVGNLRLSTTNPGAPRYRVFGKQAMVPGHFLWNLNQRAVRSTTGGGSGKGATAKQSISEKFVDLGVAICDGPIKALIRGFGNDTAFLGSEFNDTVFSEHRMGWSIQTSYRNSYTPPTEGRHFKLRGRDSAVDVKPLTEFFSYGDIVRAENTGSSSVNYGNGTFAGYFRVDRVNARTALSGSSPVPTYMTLAQLNNQDALNASTMGAGTLNDPLRIRLMEEGVAGHSYNFSYFDKLGTLVEPEMEDVGSGRDFIDADGNALRTRRYRMNVCPPTSYAQRVSSGYTGTSPTGGSGRNGTHITVLADDTRMYNRNMKIDSLYLLQGFCHPDDAAYNSPSTALVPNNGFAGFTDFRRAPVINWATSPAWANPQAVPAPTPVRAVLSEIFKRTNDPKRTDDGVQYRCTIEIVEDDLRDILGDPMTNGQGRDYRLGSGDAERPRILSTDDKDGSNGDYDYSHIAHQPDGTTDSASATDAPSYVTPSAAGISLDNNRLYPGSWNTLEGRIGFTMFNTSLAGGDDDLTFRYASDGHQSTLSAQEDVGAQRSVFFDGSADQSFNEDYRDSLAEIGDITSTEDGPGFRGLSYVSLTDLNLYQFGNTVPRLRWVVRRAEAQSVGQVVQEIVQITAPLGSVDQGSFAERECVGFTMGAGRSAKEAIQPLSVTYGFHLQERAGTLKMLEKSELPYIAIPAKHLNANLGRPLYSGLTMAQEDESAIPKRLLLQYSNFGDGNEEAEAAGERKVGSTEAGKSDTLIMNVRPVVGTYAQMKGRAQQLFDEITEETLTSATSLGPGYMDIMPGTVIGSVTNNWDDAPASSVSSSNFTFTNDGEITTPLVPGSAYISVRVIYDSGLPDEAVENFVVTDDALGNLTGWPASIYAAGATLPTIDYDASAGADIVNLTLPPPNGYTTVELDTNHPPTMSYRFDRLLTMRASKVNFNGLDMSSEVRLVRQRYDGENLRANFGVGVNKFKPLSQPAPSTVGLVPIDVPAIYGGQGNSIQVGLGVETGNPNLVGAVIFESPNGTDQWEERDQIVGIRPQGNFLNADALPAHTVDNPIHAYVDWSTELLLRSKALGTVLENATREDIALGKNNILLGDLSGGKQGEIIGYHEATFVTNDPNEEFDYWLIRGIVRGLHKTEYAAYQTHSSTAEFILLTDLGGAGTAYYTDPAGLTAGGQTRYFKAVPPGQPIELATSQTIPFKGASAMAPAPIVEVEEDGSGDIQITWHRRAFDRVPVFGMDTTPAGWHDRYEVWAFTVNTYDGTHESVEADAVAQWVVGGQTQGSEQTERSLTWTSAQQTADGATGLTGFIVYQIGPTGRGQSSAPIYLTV